MVAENEMKCYKHVKYKNTKSIKAIKTFIVEKQVQHQKFVNDFLLTVVK